MFACLCGNKNMLICHLTDYLSNNNLLSSSVCLHQMSFCYLFMTDHLIKTCLTLLDFSVILFFLNVTLLGLVYCFILDKILSAY